MKSALRLPHCSRNWLLIGAVLLIAMFSAQVSLAATITVDDTNCGLAAAITAANTDSNSHNSNCTAGSGADTIVLGTNWSSPKTLSQALPNISSQITIEGNSKDINGNSAYRIFFVATGGNLTIKDMALSAGAASGSTGGGIYIDTHGRARLEGVRVTHSDADQGAGIYANGSLTVINSVVSNNTATTSGGGIHVGPAGSATIQGSEMSINSAGSGGAIYAQGPITVINSTLINNSANGLEGGGGIYVERSSTTVTHVTFIDNEKGSSSTNGADILVKGGSLSLRNSILTDSNVGDNDDNCAVPGSGGKLSQNVGNIIQHGSGGCTSSQTSFGTGTLTGSPQYIKLNSGNAAIGFGAAEFCKSVKVDQRGFYRPETACDAGAYEDSAFNYIYVDSGGQCTLPEAINSANNNSADPGCISGVEDDTATDLIWLQKHVTTAAAMPTVDSTMVIDGGGRSITMTGAEEIFAVSSNGGLTLRNITVSGGDGTSAGAVDVNGTLSLQNCVFRNNRSRASTGGGGAISYIISSSGGTIDRCAFIDNRSQNVAGAINISAGDVTISNSLFYKNHSTHAGGAIRISGGTVTLAHVTVWDNTTNSALAVTGIQSGGTTNLYNSIIGRSTTEGGALCGGSFNNSSTERGIITFNGPQTDNCGTVTVANPLLGGLTGSIPYLPLSAGSPAIAQGIDAQCANYPIDQAGRARPATKCDIGSAQFVASPPADYDGADLEPPKTGGRWVQYADGSWHYVRTGDEGEDGQRPVCTGERLNESGNFKVSTTYGLCTGVQFNQLQLSAIGIGYVVEAGPIAAVDVWGWVTATVEVCYRGRVSALFLDAAHSPRAVSQLASVWDGEWTCAQISRAGTIVLMPADSYLTTPPVDADAPESPPAATPLANCMARLDYMLNFRETPGGQVMMILPYSVKLTAFQRTADWVEVDWYGQRGWVSAAHVTFEGTC